MKERHFDVIIVGSGLGGLLSALRLSSLRSDLKILLAESRADAGGRLVSGAMGQSNQVSSGLPMEILGQGAKALYTEIQSLLSPSEAESFGDRFLIHLNPLKVKGERRSPLSGPGYVIRKELTPMTVLFRGPSECLTRQGAASLQSFLVGDDSGKFADTNFWKSLRKPQREEVKPFFEVLAGSDFEDCQAPVLRTLVKRSVQADSVSVRGEVGVPIGGEAVTSFSLPWELAPIAEIASRVVAILEARGVEIAFGTKLENLRVKSASAASQSVCIEGTALKHGQAPERLFASRAIVTVPLSQCLSLVEREVLSPAESRFVTKQRPRSAMMLEIEKPFEAPEYLDAGFDVDPVALAKLGRAPENLKLVFPIERVQGLRTVDGRLILYSFLDYEVSMQAPSVRDALARIKRALKRILPSTELEIFARVAGTKDAGSSVTEQGIVRRSLGERLILIPVAQSVPPTASKADLPVCAARLQWSVDTQTWVDEEMGIQGATASARSKAPLIFLIGEHFRECHESWRSVVESARWAALGCASLEVSPEVGSHTAQGLDHLHTEVGP